MGGKSFLRRTARTTRKERMAQTVGSPKGARSCCSPPPWPGAFSASSTASKSSGKIRVEASPKSRTNSLALLFRKAMNGLILWPFAVNPLGDLLHGKQGYHHRKQAHSLDERGGEDHGPANIAGSLWLPRNAFDRARSDLSNSNPHANTSKAGAQPRANAREVRGLSLRENRNK